MQRVQTLLRLVLPLAVTIRTLLRLGSHRLLVLLCAWETLLPVNGPLPQISHTLAISNSPYIACISTVIIPTWQTNKLCKEKFISESRTIPIFKSHGKRFYDPNREAEGTRKDLMPLSSKSFILATLTKSIH